MVFTGMGRPMRPLANRLGARLAIMPNSWGGNRRAQDATMPPTTTGLDRKGSGPEALRDIVAVSSQMRVQGVQQNFK